ncbi:MAG: zf-HC2 domain-containing protein [Phycisphaerae bacterium]|nr:zf-HC2 domain-containing protein [Phycisphaerae bacterium]
MNHTNAPHKPSMDCIAFKVLLSPYIDGDLARAQRFEVDRHLIECPSCRSLLERAEATDESIRTLCAANPAYRTQFSGNVGLPADFETAVMKHVRSSGSMRWKRLSGSLGLLAAAAAVALTAVVWYVQPDLRTPDRGARDASLGGLVNDAPQLAPEWQDLGPGVYGPPRALIASRDMQHLMPSVTADETQVVHGASLLLDAMSSVPFEDIAARERLRQIAVYDEMLLRLGQLDRKLDAINRRNFAGARATLLELVRNTSDVTSWNAMQEDLRAFDLAGVLEDIVAASDARLDA